MQRFLGIFIILITAACSHTMEMKPGYTFGQYSIKKFNVKPDPARSHLASDPDYQEVFTRINQAYPWERLGQGKAPEASLTVIITDVNLNINPALAILVSNSYRLSAIIELRDLNTQNLIGSSFIAVASNNQSGVLGAVIDATHSNATNESYKRELIQKFVKTLKERIYPQAGN